MTNQVWTPPENPNPGDIYEEAIKDRKNKRYELALAKHIWFHENSVKIDPAYIGVRLSYNLEGWSLLAKELPRAKEVLLEMSDAVRKLVLNTDGDFRNAFKDFAAINYFMNTPQNTVELFILLEDDCAERAKQVFEVAFSDLLEAEEYERLIKYIDLELYLNAVEKSYKMSLKDSIDLDMKEELKEYAEQHLTYKLGALIAILVNSNMKQEAELVVQQYSNKIESLRYRNALNTALRGTPPPKWP